MTIERESLYARPDPHLDVRFPEGYAPSIAAHRIHNPEAPVADFSSASWPLGALDTGTRPTRTIHFSNWPAGFQDFARHVAYVLINHGNPEALVEQPGSTAVRWPSGASIDNILHRLRNQVLWLTTDWTETHRDTPITRPSHLDSDHLDDLKAWIGERFLNPRMRGANLADLVRVWHLNPWLPEHCRWPEPTWRHQKWQPKRQKEENRSIPIDQSTFSPLLEWATAFVTCFAPDILGAHRHYQERVGASSRPDAHASAGSYLDQYVLGKIPLPPKPDDVGHRIGAGVGWRVLEYRHGPPAKSFASAYRGKRTEALQIGQDMALSALDSPVSAKFHGVPWTPFIGVYDVAPSSGRPAGSAGPLVRHLRTACLIVVASLTGMRPEEVLNLRLGCAPPPIPRPGGSRLQLLRGHVFKGVGRLENGWPREPRSAAWATVPLAAKAVSVVEEINSVLGHDDGPLFLETGATSAYTGTASGSIASFIDFVNTRLVPLTAKPAALTIGADPDGAVTLKRFRRTLAWFLRHRPNGDVTAAIQFQHVGVVLGEGYAGTKASGMPDLLLEEDWNHRTDTIRHLAELLSDGEGIYGPAAGRAIDATQRLPRLLTPSEERRLRKDKSLMIYDNPAAIALCIYDEPKALCRKLKLTGRDQRPDLLGCVEGCHNFARTEDHLLQLKRQADALRDQAKLAPAPMAQSMLAKAERNKGIVEQFEVQRATLTSSELSALPSPPEQPGPKGD